MKLIIRCLAAILTMASCFFAISASAAETTLVYLRDCMIEKVAPSNSDSVALYSVDDELQQWNIPFIKAEAAWELGAVGHDVRVAVIDSGIFSEHPDIDDTRILEGFNYFTQDSNTNYDALHGTRVTGVIAAIRNNGTGINGIADMVEIVPFKCFEYDVTSLERILKAIYDAIDVYDCKILNMSFGTYINSKELSDAMKYAEEKGVITIASVGNKGDATVFYPAGYDTVIGVGGLDVNGLASESSQKNQSVTVCAPSELIISTAYPNDNQYTVEGGTSFATPQVTSLAAIVKSINPDITPVEFRQLLIETVDDAGEPGWDSSYGYGCLNIENTVAQLLDSMLISNISKNSFNFSLNSKDITISEETSDLISLEIENDFVFNNTVRAGQKAMVFVGIYDDKNRLVTVKSEKVIIKGFGETSSIQLSIPLNLNPNINYHQKAFLWDLNHMLPLAKSIVSDIFD